MLYILCLCLSWSLQWCPSLPKNASQIQLSVSTQASFHILFSTSGWEFRVKSCQTWANNMTLFLSPHYTHITIPKQWNCFDWKLISLQWLPSIKQSCGNQEVFFPFSITINYIPHLTLQCLIPHGPERWSPGALPQESGCVCVFSTAKKVDLQFAMEATNTGSPAFEEFLSAISRHMFGRENKANFLRQYANFLLI